MKYMKYLFIFILIFISLVFTFTLYRGDTFVNYGFSYAITLGEIPYKDFNLVIPPLSSLLYSIGLLINNSIITYYLEQSILILILYLLLEKLLDKKVYLYFLILCIIYPISFPTILYPGYNFIVFLLLILIIYCEEKNKNDYLIGFLLGLIICTKHTIGLPLLIPSLFQYKKLLKRLIGLLIPISLLLIYLLLTNSLSYFINYCILGLFSFTSHNTNYSISNILFLLIGLFYILYNIYKDKKNITNYYFLFYIIISFPIIDYYHVSLFLLGPLFLLIRNIPIKTIHKKVLIPIFILIYSLDIIVVFLFLNKPTILNTNHFPLYVVSTNYKKSVLELDNYLDKQNKEIIYLLRGSENYMYKIMNNKKINYYDLPNHGNYGLLEKEVEEEINKKRNVLFVIDSTLCINKDPYQQYICSFKEKAINNSKLIKKIDNYEIYERE